MEILILVLSALVATALSFAAAFTIITILVANKRRVRPKYHFVGAAEIQEPADAEMDSARASEVDSESARLEWERKNNTSY